ncbi:MAG: nucleoside deaminase [Spirochaetes bacterium]|nr:nucleoside deaminase [Spirochaetota bacterium]MBN2771462.1 nucleoside deaminase [Spirochaetota bacterium]
MISKKIISIILENQQQAIACGNPPFSAIITLGDDIIASACNQSRSTGNPLKHAEISAIESAISIHGASILQKAHLISSNEPCPMCIGACIWSGIPIVTYFISQEQVADIRGWGKFMPARDIAAVDDSGIVINGPIDNIEMRKLHQDFWTADSNSQYKHSIHLSGSAKTET